MTDYRAFNYIVSAAVLMLLAAVLGGGCGYSSVDEWKPNYNLRPNRPFSVLTPEERKERIRLTREGREVQRRFARKIAALPGVESVDMDYRNNVLHVVVKYQAMVDVVRSEWPNIGDIQVRTK